VLTGDKRNERGSSDKMENEAGQVLETVISEMFRQIMTALAQQRERFAAQHLAQIGTCAVHQYPQRWEKADGKMVLIEEVVLVPLGSDDIGPYEQASQLYPHQAFRVEVIGISQYDRVSAAIIGLHDGRSLEYSKMQETLLRVKLDKFKP